MTALKGVPPAPWFENVDPPVGPVGPDVPEKLQLTFSD